MELVLLYLHLSDKPTVTAFHPHHLLSRGKPCRIFSFPMSCSFIIVTLSAETCWFFESAVSDRAYDKCYLCRWLTETGSLHAVDFMGSFTSRTAASKEPSLDGKLPNYYVMQFLLH